jgi:hypothetical protein
MARSSVKQEQPKLDRGTKASGNETRRARGRNDRGPGASGGGSKGDESGTKQRDNEEPKVNPERRSTQGPEEKRVIKRAFQ